MIFAFKYMYMLLGWETLINSFLHKLFLNKRIKIQEGCQSFPIIAAKKTARVTLTFKTTSTVIKNAQTNCLCRAFMTNIGA